MAAKIISTILGLSFCAWILFQLFRGMWRDFVTAKDFVKSLSDVGDGKSPLQYPPESEKHKEAEKIDAG